MDSSLIIGLKVFTLTVMLLTLLGVLTERKWPYSLYGTTILSFIVMLVCIQIREWLPVFMWAFMTLVWMAVTIKMAPSQFRQLGR